MFWWQPFGPPFVAEIRQKRMGGMRRSRSGWHLDEMFVNIDGLEHYLRRSVEH